MTHLRSIASGPGADGQSNAELSRRLRHARIAYAVRRVDPEVLEGAVHAPDLQPRAGDLVLARVDHVGDPADLDLAAGRTGALFEGDDVLVAYGDDLSLERFEAYVPPDLRPCHLVAAGGMAAVVASACEGSTSPTRLTPLGLVTGGDGVMLNLSAFSMARARPAATLPPVMACVGTSQDSSAMQAVSRLVRGLSRAGYRVGVARVTGVASGSERWLLEDAGAAVVADMTDAGQVSTAALDRAGLVDLMHWLVASVGQHLVDVIVLDLASPLSGADTGTLIQTTPFAELVDGAVLLAPDATGAVAAVRLLNSTGVPVIALSGTLARSPLAVRVVFSATGLQCLRSEELAQPRRADTLFRDLAARSIKGSA
jgi:hypothetical protein